MGLIENELHVRLCYFISLLLRVYNYWFGVCRRSEAFLGVSFNFLSFTILYQYLYITYILLTVLRLLSPDVPKNSHMYQSIIYLFHSHTRMNL
jgi:hypothetical protein